MFCFGFFVILTASYSTEQTLHQREGMRIYIKLISIVLGLLFLKDFTYGQGSKPLPDNRQKQVSQYLEMINVFQNDGNLKQAATFINKIAFIYWENENLFEAIDYFLKSAEINKKIENYNDIKAIYSNIGVLYTDMEQLDKALEYFNLSLETRRKIGKREEICSGLIDVSYIQLAQGEHDKAIETLLEALEVATAINNPKLMANCYGYLAQGYKNQGNLKKYAEYNEKYIASQQNQEKEIVKREFEQREIKNIAEIEREKAEKRARELEYELTQFLNKAREDSLSFRIQNTEDSLSRVEQVNKQKQTEIELLNKERILKDLEIKEQQAKQKFQELIIYSVGGGLIFMILMAIILYTGYKSKKRTNIVLNTQNREIAEKSQELETALDKIEKQNIHITQSINYAQGIQQSMLPRLDELNEILPDSFILFKPRDIVSGDFYWFKEVDSASNIFKIFNLNKRKTDESEKPILEKKIIIAAIDCTGHGVPGAFMSMVGYNLFEETVNKGITKASYILEELNKGVRRTLKQDTTENRDGMDLALVVIDPKRKILEYSGAKNPLVYIKNKEMFFIKGDNNPIGGMPNKDITYQHNEIEIDSPITCYLFSDGFIDQFGGPDGRKFMIKKFRELLFEIHDRTFEEQKEILDLTIEGWRGDKYSQVDDILVIGFKIDPASFTSNEVV